MIDRITLSQRGIPAHYDNLLSYKGIRRSGETNGQCISFPLNTIVAGEGTWECRLHIRLKFGLVMTTDRPMGRGTPIILMRPSGS